MDKIKLASTFLYKNLNEDLMEFGISENEIREKILKNVLDPQNYQEILSSEDLNNPFLEINNGFIFSKKEVFIKQGISNKIKEIFHTFQPISSSLEAVVHQIFHLNSEQILALHSSLKTPFPLIISCDAVTFLAISRIFFLFKSA